MSSHVLPFVNYEAIVTVWLNSQLSPPYKAVTDLPTPLDPALPLVQVEGGAGTTGDETTDRPRVDLGNMAATRTGMWALTEQTHNAMSRLAGQEIRGQLIDRVSCPMHPSFLRWSPTVLRTIATYELQFRPRS